MSTPIAITRAIRVSPSSAELMRSCLLKAALSMSPASAQYVLGNPKAWLGSAYHEVLAQATHTDAEDLSAVAERVWQESVDEWFRRSQAHPLNMRFGTPDRWPGYHLIKALAMQRAREYCRKAQGATSGAAVVSGALPTTISEQPFSALGGRLVGRPDLIDGTTIIDFKTGSVLDGDGSEHVKPSYARQLRLYGFLVHEALAYWPTHGVLAPMDGSAVTVDLSPTDCTDEANAAVNLLERYNDALPAGIDALASPSSEACRWCPFKATCSSFWTAVTPDWSDALGAHAIVGTVSDSAKRLQNGAYSLQLQSVIGTAVADVLDLAPIDSTIGSSVTSLKTGARVRIVGLMKASDGGVRASRRSVFVEESAIPQVVFSSDAAPA